MHVFPPNNFLLLINPTAGIKLIRTNGGLPGTFMFSNQWINVT